MRPSGQVQWILFWPLKLCRPQKSVTKKMAFSLNNPTSFSALGSLGAHIILIAFAGNYILSQDRLIPPPKRTVKLEFFKKNKPPILKRKEVKEVKRKRMEPIQPKTLPKVLPDVQVPAHRLNVREVTRIIPQVLSPRTVVARNSLSVNNPVSSVLTQAVRATNSIAAPRRETKMKTANIAARGGRLIRGITRRVLASSVSAVPRNFDVPDNKPLEGALQTTLLSSGVIRLPASTFTPRQVPSAIDKGALQGYSRYIQNKIASSKKYPKKAKRDGREGEVTVQFTVLKSGSIRNLFLVSRTPYDDINKAALNAVRRAAPFPRLPEEIGREFLELELPFRFELK